MADYGNDFVSFDCELMDETEKAWRVMIDDTDYWVPKSMSEWTPISKIDKVNGTLEIATWWARKEGLA